VVRLVVPSPDGSRVMARPNGLAGWTLPTVAVDLPFDRWDDEVTGRAAGVVGAPIVVGARVSDDTWVVRATGRVPSAGRTWIGMSEVDRLGADAPVVRAWSARAEVEAPPAHEDGPG
jgi:hypothetical protein